MRSPTDFSFWEEKTSLPTIFKHFKKGILREAESDRHTNAPNTARISYKSFYALETTSILAIKYKS